MLKHLLRASAMLAMMSLTIAACSHGGIDFGDNPPKAMAKTDPKLTAPPLELRNGSATEAAKIHQ